MQLREWLTLIETINYQNVTSGFDLCEAIKQGVETWGNDAIIAAADRLRRSDKTIQNWLSLARSSAFQLARGLNQEHENYNLTISHVSEVSGLADEHAATLLSQAGEGGWTIELLRFKVNEWRNQNKSKEERLLDLAKLNTKPAADSNVQTYHMEISAMPAPVPAAHTLSGAVAVHRNWTPDEDTVPFAEPELYVDEADTPFDVAERIVDRWGVPFAKQVADEILRWGEWT